MSNLVTMAVQSLAPQFISRLAGPLGIPPALAEQAMGAIIPTLLGGALQQSATPAGADGLVSALNRLDPGQLANLTSGAVPIDPVGEAQAAGGDSAVSALLGGAGGQNILGGLSSLLGMKSGIVSTLASVAAPLVLGTIGKAVGANPSPSGVQSLLAGQRDNILSALPPGVGSMLGLSAPERPATPDYEPAIPEQPKRNWLPWILGALVLLALLYALTQCNREPVTETAPVVPTPEPAATAPVNETVTLPGGGTIAVPPGSIGYQLATFLASTDPAPKTFVFDNLTFATASDVLTPESATTVGTIASILNAYPNANATIVGYTDNQGDPAANRTLSQNRANVVSKALTAAGVAATRLKANGLGEGSPVADNATEEGRARNRRTELTVTQK